jgi:predicted Rossmann fold flavoprotein
MTPHRVVVAGGGAAGFFAAATCAEEAKRASVLLFEKGPHFLSKVRISGGGRCNVTRACFDPRELAEHFPRGAGALLGAFHQFQPSDTIAWFEARGVKLKTEADGRMFPLTDSSQTIIDCLVNTAKSAGVELAVNLSVERVVRGAGGGFELSLSNAQTITCDRLLLSTGGCRAATAGRLAVALGHTLEPPVPSLFTFHIEASWLRELAGISVDQVEVAVPSLGLRECGPILLTHSGLSGPAILRLSAWGARELHRLNYHFTLRLNWLAQLKPESIAQQFGTRRAAQPARFIVNSPPAQLPIRLWERIVLASGIARETRWAALSRAAQHSLIQQLTRMELRVTGKTLNQDEFVTCGGVRLNEVNFKTMESRLCPGLYFAGELLDIDGLTGGFNFQAAWTTGWIAGRAMATSAA